MVWKELQQITEAGGCPITILSTEKKGVQDVGKAINAQSLPFVTHSSASLHFLKVPEPPPPTPMVYPVFKYVSLWLTFLIEITTEDTKAQP